LSNRGSAPRFCPTMVSGLPNNPACSRTRTAIGRWGGAINAGRRENQPKIALHGGGMG
jgi:hypothetical protein